MQYPSQVEFADVADFETIPEASSVRKRETRTAGKSSLIPHSTIFLSDSESFLSKAWGPAPGGTPFHFMGRHPPGAGPISWVFIKNTLFSPYDISLHLQEMQDKFAYPKFSVISTYIQKKFKLSCIEHHNSNNLLRDCAERIHDAELTSLRHWNQYHDAHLVIWNHFCIMR